MVFECLLVLFRASALLYSRISNTAASAPISAAVIAAKRVALP